MDKTKIAFILGGVFLVGLILLVVIFGVRRNGPAELSGTLTLWGVFDDPAVMNEIINDYKRLRPRAQIVYQQINAANYESDLINQLATPQSPDLFMFHNSWLPKHFDKLWPLTDSQLSLSSFRGIFPTVVEQDFAPDGVIYALPLYLDTLAMFYNKDIFDTKGIAVPPTTWTEFQEMVKKVRELDRTGRPQKAAAAIGGSNKSVNRGSDILNLLMLQTGIKMVEDDFSRASFAREGIDPLNFYTQFSNPRNEFYTWSESLPYSIDSFAEGQTAVIFNYAHQVAILKEKNPFLNFAIAAMPQPSDAKTAVNIANYWGLAVSAKSPNPALAWDFILYLTANSDVSRKYLQLTGKPPALRTLIPSYNNQELGIFAKQALTARSWPQIDNVIVDNAFSKAIEETISGRLTAPQALQQAEDTISNLMTKRR